MGNIATNKFSNQAAQVGRPAPGIAGINVQNNYTDLKSTALGFSYYDMKKLEFNKISICK